MNLIAAGLGPLIFGLSKDFTGGYDLTICVSALLVLFASSSLFMVNLPIKEEF